MQDTKTEQEILQSVDNQLTILESAMDRTQGIPVEFRQSVMDFQMWLDQCLRNMKRYHVAVEINGMLLKMEDLLSDSEIIDDEMSDLKNSVEQLTFESDSVLQILKHQLGLLDDQNLVPTAEQPS